MKKILTFILVAVLGIGLGLLIRPSQPTKVENEQHCLYGKNYLEYCVDVYEPSTNIVNAKELVDTTKYPSYMIDEEGYYLPFEELGIRFKEKYFGVTEAHAYDDYYFLDFINPNITKFKFTLEGSYNADDIFAKAVLLLNEFRNYGFYYASNGIIIVEVYWLENGMTNKLKLGVSVGTLINDAEFQLTVDSFVDGEFGNLIYTEECQVNKITAKSFYENYVTNETFIGYVLDYK